MTSLDRVEVNRKVNFGNANSIAITRVRVARRGSKATAVFIEAAAERTYANTPGIRALLNHALTEENRTLREAGIAPALLNVT